MMGAWATTGIFTAGEKVCSEGRGCHILWSGEDGQIFPLISTKGRSNSADFWGQSMLWKPIFLRIQFMKTEIAYFCSKYLNFKLKTASFSGKLAVCAVRMREASFSLSFPGAAQKCFPRFFKAGGGTGLTENDPTHINSFCFHPQIFLHASPPPIEVFCWATPHHTEGY